MRCRRCSARWPCSASRSACAAIPMLRDAGPVERLGGRIGGVREPTERTLGDARSSSRRWPRGSGRGCAPSLRAGRRAALEHKLDYAGRPAGMTVQRFIGRKAALALLLGPRRRRPAAAARLARRSSSPLLALVGWFGPDV